MAKKIDKRKLIIPSLRLRTKAKKTERCANCLHYHNDTQVKGYGRCKLFDVRVRKNELCDSLSTFNLHREVGIESINGRRIQTLNKEQVTDLKKYKTIGRRGSKIEESRGVIEEVQYTPIVTTTDYEKGFIDRYFVQRKSNPNNPVLEVESFSNFNDLMFFLIVESTAPSDKSLITTSAYPVYKSFISEYPDNNKLFLGSFFDTVPPFLRVVKSLYAPVTVLVPSYTVAAAS